MGLFLSTQMPVKPEQYQTRAELVYMSDSGCRWIVTMFDLTTLSDGWCVEMDAFTGDVAMSYTTYDGFFWDAYNAWTEQKGPHALWSLEDKQLYDALQLQAANTAVFQLDVQPPLGEKAAVDGLVAVHSPVIAQEDDLIRRGGEAAEDIHDRGAVKKFYDGHDMRLFSELFNILLHIF